MNCKRRCRSAVSTATQRSSHETDSLDDFGVSAEVYGVAQLTARSLINSASKFMPIEGDLLLH
jgi:hypothetical protein